MENYRTASHSKTALKAHLVWVPKYRKKVLFGDTAIRVRDLVREVCQAKDVEIISGKVAVDHVHLFIAYPPHLSISNIMKLIKGRSSRLLRQEFPNLRSRLPTLWTNAYFVTTVGGAPFEVIKQYIENQKAV